MSEEVILKKAEPLLTKLPSDMWNNFQGVDVSKFQSVNLVPQSVIDSRRQIEEISKHILTSEERAKPITDRMDKQIQLLEEQLEQEKDSNKELQGKLDDAYIQLRQLNDKNAIQTGELKNLCADLKEESLKRELAETKLNAKDWKTAFIALGTGLLVLAVEHWKDILDFLLP